MDETSTLLVIHPEGDEGRPHLRRRRLLYLLTTTALAALAIAVVADGFLPVFGVDTDVAEDRAADGTLLRVEYTAVTRPALASPLAIEVLRADGFTEPIEIAISRPLIEVWDENGFYPTPSAETGDGDWVVWEFDPPDGELFRFFYDARLEPSRQSGVSGRIELREDGAAVAAVSIDVEVRP